MKKLTEIKNPLTMKETSITDVSAWTGGILWVMLVGFVLAIGVKALNFVDAKLPGSQTPDIAPYKQPAAGDVYNIL